MHITPIPIVIAKSDKNIYHKFILLETGELLYGMCLYHKQLADAYTEMTGIVLHSIIGAGIIPTDVTTPIEDTRAWGEWKSTGYNVITPQHIRSEIRDIFIKTLHPNAE